MLNLGIDSPHEEVIKYFKDKLSETSLRLISGNILEKWFKEGKLKWHPEKGLTLGRVLLYFLSSFFRTHVLRRQVMIPPDYRTFQGLVTGVFQEKGSLSISQVYNILRKDFPKISIRNLRLVIYKLRLKSILSSTTTSDHVTTYEIVAEEDF